MKRSLAKRLAALDIGDGFYSEHATREACRRFSAASQVPMIRNTALVGQTFETTTFRAFSVLNTDDALYILRIRRTA